MKTTKIKPTATIVAQFAAGVEVTAISHEGNLYLPVISLGELAPKESAPTSDDDDKEEVTEKKSAPKKESAESSSKTYTEDELMDMDVKALTKILKDDFGIDPSDYDGKNTNKKLRKLILDAQDGTEDEEETEEEEEQPKKSPKKSSKKSEDKEEDEDLAVKAGDILDDYDAGKNSKKKATSLLMKLVGTDDTDGVNKFLDKFDDDEDGDIDDYAQKFVDKFGGSDDNEDDDDDDDEEKEETPKKRHSKKSEKKEDDDEYVAIEDLKKGDRVSVWWDDENKDWFDGTVKSVRGGKVTVAYDDDTEDVLDPKVNTKIKVLDED